MVFILAKYNQHLHYTVTANTEAIEKMDVWRNKSFRPNHFHCIFFVVVCFFGGVCYSDMGKLHKVYSIMKKKDYPEITQLPLKSTDG